jgi:hypothetical protein
MMPDTYRMEYEFDRESLVVDRTSQRPFLDKSRSPAQRVRVLSVLLSQSDHSWGTMLSHRYGYSGTCLLEHLRGDNRHISPKSR